MSVSLTSFVRCARQSAKSCAELIGFGAELKKSAKNSKSSLCLDWSVDLLLSVAWISFRVQSVISWVIWILPFGALAMRKKRK